MHRRHDISDAIWELLDPHLPYRICRWRDRGVWEELLVDDPDYEWLMIDASHIKERFIPIFGS